MRQDFDKRMSPCLLTDVGAAPQPTAYIEGGSLRVIFECLLVKGNVIASRAGGSTETSVLYTLIYAGS